MLVFIHIHKNAGSTVQYILRSTFGARHCNVESWRGRGFWADPFTAADLHRLRRVYPRLASVAGHHLRPYNGLESVCPELRYFALLRDPLKRSASNYQYVVQVLGKPFSFEQWIAQEMHRNRQTKMLAGTADVDAALRVIKEKEIFVGLTERFDETMLLLRRLVAPELNIAYEAVNVARRNSLAQELLETPRTRDMLIDANRADRMLYAAVKHELYPRYQEAYGPTLETDLAHYRQRQGRPNRYNLLLSGAKRALFYKPLVYLARHGVPL